MGFANLNVWISEADPCSISQQDWWVLVTDCSGHPISWCEPTVGGPNVKHGSPFPAPCGHADIKIPPGCYVVSAVRWLFLDHWKFPFFTDSCVVTMGCGESACVHLYRRSDRQHLQWTVDAASRLAEKGTIPRDKAERLREAVEAVLEHLTKTVQDLEQEQMIKQLPKLPEPKPGSC